MRTPEEWYSSIGYDDSFHAWGCSREFALKCIAAIQRDALEEAARVVGSIRRAELMLAAGEMTIDEWRASAAMQTVAVQRIRALLPKEKTP